MYPDTLLDCRTKRERYVSLLEKLCVDNNDFGQGKRLSTERLCEEGPLATSSETWLMYPDTELGAQSSYHCKPPRKVLDLSNISEQKLREVVELEAKMKMNNNE